jgi:hypothetical protein
MYGQSPEEIHLRRAEAQEDKEINVLAKTIRLHMDIKSKLLNVIARIISLKEEKSSMEDIKEIEKRLEYLEKESLVAIREENIEKNMDKLILRVIVKARNGIKQAEHEMVTRHSKGDSGASLYDLKNLGKSTRKRPSQLVKSTRRRAVTKTTRKAPVKRRVVRRKK